MGLKSNDYQTKQHRPVHKYIVICFHVQLRQIERERETDRQTDSQTDRQTDRDDCGGVGVGVNMIR